MTQMFYSSATTLPMMLDKLPNSVLGMRWEASLPETSLLNNTGSLLLIAPLVILYVFLQRFFVESVQRTGITGQ